MANSLNPFCEDDDYDREYSIEDKLELDVGSPKKCNVSDVSLDAVASKLLKENFILTALELHTELLENKKELPKLRDFFSNPLNFERASKFQEGQSALR